MKDDPKKQLIDQGLEHKMIEISRAIVAAVDPAIVAGEEKLGSGCETI